MKTLGASSQRTENYRKQIMNHSALSRVSDSSPPVFQNDFKKWIREIGDLLCFYIHMTNNFNIVLPQLYIDFTLSVLTSVSSKAALS